MAETLGTGSPFRVLGVTTPVFAAPMAGGPSTPELVIAAARAGGLGFLAGGYRTAAALQEQMAKVRAAGVSFGVNLFAPNPVPVDHAEFARYARLIADEGARYGLDLRDAAIVEDDDRWTDKLDLLLADPVPAVSFTFAIPPREVIMGLRRAGTLVAQTVTSASEARLATGAGADVIIVQACAAGGHSGTLTPEELPADIPLADLLAQIRAAVPVPLVAAGGIATAAEVAMAPPCCAPTKPAPAPPTGPRWPTRPGRRPSAPGRSPAGPRGACAIASPTGTARRHPAAIPRCTI